MWGKLGVKRTKAVEWSSRSFVRRDGSCSSQQWRMPAFIRAYVCGSSLSLSSVELSLSLHSQCSLFSLSRQRWKYKEAFLYKDSLTRKGEKELWHFARPETFPWRRRKSSFFAFSHDGHAKKSHIRIAWQSRSSRSRFDVNVVKGGEEAFAKTISWPTKKVSFIQYA